ncbi:MAG: DUF599 family protein [Pseudomonadota bacterium]
MTGLDYAALGVFFTCWLGLEPVLKIISRRRACITSDMHAVRALWMRQLLRRNFLLVDAQILGHTIHSASFFGSANLLVIVGIGGALASATESANTGIALDEARTLLLLAPLLRGLFDFIWSVRQLNYFLAALGASPFSDNSSALKPWAEALSGVLTRALTTFSAGVRNYYFAFAASLWLFGPGALLVGSIGTAMFLIWRQTESEAARRIREFVPLLPSVEANEPESQATAKESGTP